MCIVQMEYLARFSTVAECPSAHGLWWECIGHCCMLCDIDGMVVALSGVLQACGLNIYIADMVIKYHLERWSLLRIVTISRRSTQE